MTKDKDPDQEKDTPSATSAEDAAPEDKAVKSDADPAAKNEEAQKDDKAKDEKAEDSPPTDNKHDDADIRAEAEPMGTDELLYESAAIEPEANEKDKNALVPAPEKSGGGLGVIVAVLVILAAFVGGVWATQPLWLPHLAAKLPMAGPDPSLDPRLQDLENKVAALQGEMDKVKQAPAGANAMADLQGLRSSVQADLSAVVNRVSELEGRLSAVRKMAAATALPGEAASTKAEITGLSDQLQTIGTDVNALNDLMQRISQLEAEGRTLRQEAQIDGRDIADVLRDLEDRVGSVEQRDQSVAENQAMVLVVGQLRAALESDAPYAGELQSLKAVAPGTSKVAKAIDVLAKTADSGVPTINDLSRSFEKVSGAIIAADRQLEGQGWLQTTVNSLSSMVTIRKTDPNAAQGTDQVVALAESHLDNGDLISAIDALGALSGEPKKAAAAWLEQAQSRVMVEKALATLHVHAVARLAPGSAAATEANAETKE